MHETDGRKKGSWLLEPDNDRPTDASPLGSIPVERILSKVDALFAKKEVGAVERLLVYWKTEAIALRDKRGELTMENELVGHYRLQNDREKGLSSVRSVLELTKELEQDKQVSGGTFFLNCATAYKAFGMPSDALPLYVAAERIYQKELPPTDPRFGGLYNNMALALADLSQFADAETAYQKALSVMEAISGEESKAAVTYVNLAHLYERMGKNERIGDCMKKAYELLHSEHLQHDGAYAFVLEKCAPSFGYFGNSAVYEEFKKEYERIYAGA